MPPETFPRLRRSRRSSGEIASRSGETARYLQIHGVSRDIVLSPWTPPCHPERRRSISRDRAPSRETGCIQGQRPISPDLAPSPWTLSCLQGRRRRSAEGDAIPRASERRLGRSPISTEIVLSPLTLPRHPRSRDISLDGAPSPWILRRHPGIRHDFPGDDAPSPDPSRHPRRWSPVRRDTALAERPAGHIGRRIKKGNAPGAFPGGEAKQGGCRQKRGRGGAAGGHRGAPGYPASPCGSGHGTAASRTPPASPSESHSAP